MGSNLLTCYVFIVRVKHCGDVG